MAEESAAALEGWVFVNTDLPLSKFVGWALRDIVYLVIVKGNLKQFPRRKSLRRIVVQSFFGVASRPNQNKTTEKTEAIFLFKNVTKKRREIAS